MIKYIITQSLWYFWCEEIVIQRCTVTTCLLQLHHVVATLYDCSWFIFQIPQHLYEVIYNGTFVKTILRFHSKSFSQKGLHRSLIKSNLSTSFCVLLIIYEFRNGIEKVVRSHWRIAQTKHTHQIPLLSHLTVSCTCVNMVSIALVRPLNLHLFSLSLCLFSPHCPLRDALSPPPTWPTSLPVKRASLPLSFLDAMILPQNKKHLFLYVTETNVDNVCISDFRDMHLSLSNS